MSKVQRMRKGKQAERQNKKKVRSDTFKGAKAWDAGADGKDVQAAGEEKAGEGSMAAPAAKKAKKARVVSF